ncbi:hypothetical protein M378DRAFT_194596 [Amanita muscaria Koide BX008]|uniref:DRBM domain-containing protein n=1 Tax=Amanita muscaria (strain Koide BX008) TaxID=946122 RepID=A0A0C2XPB5_AMAMK|nr:hypothetical protein M378DRAFT_194596 [Amanita muscaria Koide BX008]
MSVPPLPRIEGDAHIILDIYTHSSLRNHLSGIDTSNKEYGDADRLALLGKSVLDLAITHHWFRKSLSPEQLRGKQRESLSDERLVEIIQGYNLGHKLRYAPGIPVDSEMCRTFLDTYVGALFIRNGQNSVQDFVSKLVDPAEDAEMQDTILLNPIPPHQPPPPREPPPPAPPAYYAPAPTTTGISLAVFNQVATQKGHTITWSAESTGPHHQPTWTVRCCLNGTEKGRGTGKSQKAAKEDAARQAWVTMGGFS